MIDEKPYGCSMCRKTVIENKIALTLFHCYKNAIICGTCHAELGSKRHNKMVAEAIDMLGEQIAIFVDGDDISEYLSSKSEMIRK